jgi:hypothetical protein
MKDGQKERRQRERSNEIARGLQKGRKERGKYREDERKMDR